MFITVNCDDETPFSTFNYYFFVCIKSVFLGFASFISFSSHGLFCEASEFSITPRVWIVHWPVSSDTPSAEQTLNTQSSLRRANACAAGCVLTPNLFVQDLGAATVCNLPACLIGPKEVHCVWVSCACECVHACCDIFLLKWFYGFIGFYLSCWPKAVIPSFFSSSFSCT